MTLEIILKPRSGPHMEAMIVVKQKYVEGEISAAQDQRWYANLKAPKAYGMVCPSTQKITTEQRGRNQTQFQPNLRRFGSSALTAAYCTLRPQWGQ